MEPVERLKQIVHLRTYASVLPDGRKETREQTIKRCRDMHMEQRPEVRDEVSKAFQQVLSEKVVPSMRTLQFGGEPIIRANERAYNCAFAALTSWADFSDLFYLLMCGTGAGYSVQKHHTDQLPTIEYDKGLGDIFVVPDSKEGWADALKTVLSSPSTELDVHLVRRKGAPLSSGGTASGPEALLKTIAETKAILRRADGRKLRPIECHDIMCHVADGVIVGGVRRAALSCLFDLSDTEMLKCKQGMWWEHNPQRARANNSAVVLRDENVSNNIRKVMKEMFHSGCGEPGIYLTSDRNYGTNPCFEISLRDGQLCNLSEVNVSKCNSKEEFREAALAATVIGTVQASYTNFSYLQDKWKENCEEEALLGVSLTGQAQKWYELQEWLGDGSVVRDMVECNDTIAVQLGINSASRITTTKPSGSTSAWLGTTSGIHASHSEYFIRRVRVDKSDPIASYLHVSGFAEEDIFNKENLVVSVPIASPDSITRGEESAVDLMNRAKFIHEKWIQPGHQIGPNTHNVSLTVSYKEEEREDILSWLTQHYDNWSGISFLPYDGGTYKQAPFESISEECYHLLSRVFDIPDLSELDYTGKKDDRLGELACAGGSCEIK